MKKKLLCSIVAVLTFTFLISIHVFAVEKAWHTDNTSVTSPVYATTIESSKLTADVIGVYADGTTSTIAKYTPDGTAKLDPVTHEYQPLTINTNVTINDASQYEYVFVRCEDDFTELRGVPRDSSVTPVITLNKGEDLSDKKQGDAISLVPNITPATTPNSAFEDIHWYMTCSDTPITNKEEFKKRKVYNATESQDKNPMECWVTTKDWNQYQLDTILEDNHPYHYYFVRMKMKLTTSVCDSPVYQVSAQNYKIGGEIKVPTGTTLTYLDPLALNYTPVKGPFAFNTEVPIDSVITDITQSNGTQGITVEEGRHEYTFICTYKGTVSVPAKLWITGVHNPLKVSQKTTPSIGETWALNQFEITKDGQVLTTGVTMPAQGQVITRLHTPLVFNYKDPTTQEVYTVLIYGEANYQYPNTQEEEKQITGITAIAAKGSTIKMSDVNNNNLGNNVHLTIYASDNKGNKTQINPNDVAYYIVRDGSNAIITVIYAQCTYDVVVPISG